MWSIQREGASATRVDLMVPRGRVKTTRAQLSNLTTSINGSRTLWKAQASVRDITLPAVHFSDPVQIQRLENLVMSSSILTLTDDLGNSYRVKGLNGITVERLEATRAPRWEVTIELVGA